MESLHATLTENGAKESEDVLVLLAQTGYREEVLPALEKAYPIEMFKHYEHEEKVEDAFRVLGLEAGAAITKEWIESSIEQIDDEFDPLENEGCKLLVTVAQFMVERGLEGEARKILDALYERMENEEIHEVNSFLSHVGGDQSTLLPGVFYPDYAIEKAQSREEEIFLPENFLSQVFTSSEKPFFFYQFLAERDEEMEDWQKVKAVFAGFGRKVDFPHEELRKLIAELEESAREQSSEKEWTLLLEMSHYLGDIPLLERSLRALNEFRDNNEVFTKSVVLKELADLLLSDGRYEEAAELFLELLEDNPRRSNLIQTVVVTLEATGQPEKAREWLEKLEKLSIGDGRWLVELGSAWGEIGEWERRHELYEHALLLLPSDSVRWAQHLFALAESARKAGQWKQALAFQEAFRSWRPFSLSFLPFDFRSPSDFFLGRGQVEFCRAMAAYEVGEIAKGDLALDRMIAVCGYDSFLADDVLPVLRQEGLHEQAERIWRTVSPTYRKSMALFPEGHNAHNGAAWVASRAACDLKEAEGWVAKALEGQPRSSAYLDTKAEVFFAQGNREKALKLSEIACQSSEGTRTLSMLRGQYRHFRDDPLPLAEEAEEAELSEEEVAD